MSFSKIIAGVFGVVFIIILYVIIYYALKIMYKDVKNGGKKRRPPVDKRKLWIRNYKFRKWQRFKRWIYYSYKIRFDNR